MAHRCPDCGEVKKTAQGLGSHRRYRHFDGGPVVDVDSLTAVELEAGELGPNRASLEVTLSILKRLGRTEDIDSAQVQTLRTLASAVDRWPDEAQLWRQYREALREVLDADDAADDRLSEALAAIRGAT